MLNHARISVFRGGEGAFRRIGVRIWWGEAPERSNQLRGAPGFRQDAMGYALALAEP